MSNKTAKVNSNVTLPCTFSWGDAPINTTLLQIIWIVKDQFVLTYCNKLTVNENRASMKIDQLKNGIASLMLSKVLTTDDGIYKCVVIYDKVHKDGIVSLHVEGEDKTCGRSLSTLKTSIYFVYHICVALTPQESLHRMGPLFFVLIS